MKLNLQKSIQNLGRSLLHTYFDIRITGQLPDSKLPLVLVGNHSGFVDGFILFTATKRPIEVLTKTEVFNNFTRWFLLSGGAIETDWKDADYAAIDSARKCLASGKDVGLFPEGTRCRGNFAWLKDGVILLNSEQKADFVPVFIFGTRLTGKSKSWIPPYKSLIEVVIGSPVNADDVYGNTFDKNLRKDIAVAGERLRQALQLQLFSVEQNVAGKLPEDDVV